MREIKFRAFCPKRGQWVYGATFAPIDRSLFYTADGDEVRVDPETVGQWTALKDKNGAEIYEGDIIKTDFDAMDDIIVVRFVRGVFAFLWNDDLDDELPTSAPTQEWAIVVGNIHDNPELLKGGGK